MSIDAKVRMKMLESTIRTIGKEHFMVIMVHFINELMGFWEKSSSGLT